MAFVITKLVCEMYTDHRVGSGLAKWQSTVSQHLVTSRDAAAATRRILSLTAVHAAHTRLMVTIKYIKISHTHTFEATALVHPWCLLPSNKVRSCLLATV